MKKNDFIYTGSALYRISKIENNLVKVVPTSRKMTCSLASRTYHQSQLEDLGYKITIDVNFAMNLEYLYRPHHKAIEHIKSYQRIMKAYLSL